MEYASTLQPLMYILLPVCTESKYDVFFNVLKNVISRVGRAKLSEHFCDNAFKNAMHDICVEAEILSNWQISDSRQELIEQSKLLGFWATTNCPTFGKIFFGDEWKCPKNNFINAVSVNGSKAMHAAEINEIIFPKLKCRLIGLDVSASTLASLKHFVQVPINEIQTENEVRVSIKTMTLDIKEECIDKCWAALRRGKWLVKTETDISQLKSKSDCNASKRARTDFEEEHYSHDSDAPLNLATKSSYGNAVHSNVEDSPSPRVDIPVNTVSHAVDVPENTVSLSLDAPSNQELNQRVYTIQNKLINQLEKSNVILESELIQRKAALVEVGKTIGSLQSLLVEKDIKMNELKNSIHALKSELNEYKQTLSDLENNLTSEQIQSEEKGELLIKLQSDVNEKDGLLVDIKHSNQALDLEVQEQRGLVAKLQNSIAELECEMNEKKGSLSELQINFEDLQMQSTQKDVSLAELQKSNRTLQMQLAEKEQSIFVADKLLKQKDASLFDLEKSNRTLQMQLNEKEQYIVEVEKLKLAIGNTIIGVESQLKEKDVSLAELQKSNRTLQMQLDEKEQSIVEAKKLWNQKDASLDDLKKSNRSLQMQLNEKEQYIVEVEKLKLALGNTIIGVESQLKEKDVSLAELQKSNRTLQMQLDEKEQSIFEAKKLWNQKDASLDDLKKSNRSLQMQLNEKEQSKSSEQHNDNSVPSVEVEKPHPDQPFESVDEVVRICRPKLLALEFAWIKFEIKDKYRPGYVHPPDADGKRRAQEILSNGYPSDEKMDCDHFKETIPEQKKASAQVKKLKLHNKKFGFSFM